MNHTIRIILRSLPFMSVLFLGLVIQSCGTFLFPDPPAPKSVVGREVLWRNHFWTSNYDGDFSNVTGILLPPTTLGKDYPRLPRVSGVHGNDLRHRMPHPLGLLEYFQGRIITWNAATGKLERYSEFLNPNPNRGISKIPYYLGASTMVYVARGEPQGSKMTGVDLQAGQIIWEREMQPNWIRNLYGIGETFFCTPAQIRGDVIIIERGLARQGTSQNQNLIIPLRQNGEYLYSAFDALPFLHPQSQDTMLFVCANIGRNLTGQMYDSIDTEYFLYNVSKQRIETRKRLLEGKEWFFAFRSVHDTFFQSSEHILVADWVIGQIFGINKVTGQVDWKERIPYNVASWDTGVRTFIAAEDYFAYQAFEQPQIRVHDTKTGKLLWSIREPSAEDDVHLCIHNNVLYYASKPGISTDTLNVWAGVDLATGKHIFRYEDGIDSGSVYEMVAREGVLFARVRIIKVMPLTRTYTRPWQEDTYLYAIKAIR